MSHEDKKSLVDKMKAAAAEAAAKAAYELKTEGKKEETEPEQKAVRQEKPTSGSYRYKANHVRRIILRNGTHVLPDADGIFTATCQEEYDYLEHLAASATSSVERLDNE